MNVLNTLKKFVKEKYKKMKSNLVRASLTKTQENDHQTYSIAFKFETFPLCRFYPINTKPVTRLRFFTFLHAC